MWEQCLRSANLSRNCLSLKQWVNAADWEVSSATQASVFKLDGPTSQSDHPGRCPPRLPATRRTCPLPDSSGSYSPVHHGCNAPCSPKKAIYAQLPLVSNRWIWSSAPLLVARLRPFSVRSRIRRTQVPSSHAINWRTPWSGQPGSNMA